jgi:general secretion pathway protein L
VSRILPPHTWLSELRLSETPDGRQVVMTGFSEAAASLVGLIDRSPLFKEAALVGPVTVDQAERKERFIIQASFGKASKPRTAAR